MQTDDLISLMTASHQPVDTGRLRRTTWLGAIAALVATVALALLTIGARPDLLGVWMTLPVLAKALFGASVAAIALAAFQSSLRPGLKPLRLALLVTVPFTVVASWAVLVLSQVPADQWSMQTFGRYWLGCLVAVPLYALCPFIILLLLARRGAPVNGRLTGACAGLASAGLAAVAYGLHCPDDTVPFLASWYVLAMAIMTALGAIIFPRLVRW